MRDALCAGVLSCHAALVAGMVLPAAADAGELTICAAEQDLRIAHGFQADRGWVTRGWTRIPVGQCQVLSLRPNQEVDVRLLALQADGVPILINRLPGSRPETEADYMRDEQLVCVAQTDFESTGIHSLLTGACDEGQSPMALPIRIKVPATTSYKLSL